MGATALPPAGGRTGLVVDRDFCQGKNNLRTPMETPSETSGVSVPNTDSAVLASAARRVRGKRAARDAALGPLQEEKTSPVSGGEPKDRVTIFLRSALPEPRTCHPAPF